MSCRNTQADMVIHFKQSESIFLYCQYVDAYGAFIELPTTIVAQVRTLSGRLVAELQAIKDSSKKGCFTLTTDPASSVLDEGSYEVDVLFVNKQDVSIASNTFSLNITHSVSQYKTSQPKQQINSPHPEDRGMSSFSNYGQLGQLVMMTKNGQRTLLSIGRYAPAVLDVSDLISADEHNVIKKGSDHRLLVENVDGVKTDADFVSVIDAVWNV